ncbi:hypothetical protein [Agrobacterium genomosp. 2]|uniref:Uncharacterized protein n=1 Tax=Agrobacterium genomosp. 2 str. CFBP 5494 TaxID=1183436 RepID=A0A9W5AYK8_9HYPH|nr:hypothetical protein [Agrobacterium genomosp. 2]CUW87510.1 hypothetical protein AGR2A_Cc120077 [Agrobacterium genomosp. 2 str. CFBP 5494]
MSALEAIIAERPDLIILRDPEVFDTFREVYQKGFVTVLGWPDDIGKLADAELIELLEWWYEEDGEALENDSYKWWINAEANPIAMRLFENTAGGAA